MFLRKFYRLFAAVPAAVAVLCLPVLPNPGHLIANASVDSDDLTEPATTPVDEPLQIVVLEAPGCTYCTLFRRYIMPAYATSQRSRDVPIKFLDVNDKAYDQLGLDGPVDMVPTAVLMRNNREVGRIAGYVGPENFFHAMNRLLAQVN